MIQFLFVVLIVVLLFHAYLWFKGYRFYPKSYVDELIERVWEAKMVRERLTNENMSLRRTITALDHDLRALNVSYDDLNEEYHQLDEEVEEHRMKCLPQAPPRIVERKKV